MTSPDNALRIALTSYRSKPHSGGQGIYVRHLASALTQLGHSVEIFSGQPYPDLAGLDDAAHGGGPRLTRVPSLDLYADDNPFRTPAPAEFWRRRDLATDLLEYATMCTAGFPEPRTFARRVSAMLLRRTGDFDLVHDNQTLAPHLLRLPAAGLPLVTTLHHPISVDRRLDLDAAVGFGRRLAVRRWYGFVAMQARTAPRLPDDSVITVSRSSMDDAVADFGMRPEQFSVIGVGVDTDLFAPRRPVTHRVPGRIVTLASADSPLKGVTVLLRALASLPEDLSAHLVVVSPLTPGGPTERLVAELGLSERVRFVHGLHVEELVDLLASATLSVVPSRYEGFSLPAIEAMACGTPLVASHAGALPDVVGTDGQAGLLVPAGDHGALAVAIEKVLRSPELRERLSAGGRDRAVRRYSWEATAHATVQVYRRAIARHQGDSP